MGLWATHRSRLVPRLAPLRSSLCMHVAPRLEPTRGPATRPEVERTIQLHPSDVRTGDQATQSPGSGVTWALNGRPWHAPLSHRSQALESGDQGGRGPWAQESRRLGPGRWAALAAGPQTWRTNVFRLQPLQSTQHLLWAPEQGILRLVQSSPGHGFPPPLHCCLQGASGVAWLNLGRGSREGGSCAGCVCLRRHLV